MDTFFSIFSALPDPRDYTARHDLCEILFIALAASLCGAQSCAEMEEFGKAKRPLLEQFLTLEHGIPSHDTFSRVFRLLDATAFSTIFMRFTAAFGTAAKLPAARGVVALDGKSLRRAYDKGRAHMPKMMVAAFAERTRLVLAQTEAPGGRESDAALEIVSLLSLKHCVVTGDALYCNAKIAQAICKAGGDYALKVKGNQPKLLATAKAALAAADETASRAETVDRGHGRHERRTALVVALPKTAKSPLTGLQAVARIDNWRGEAGKTSHDTHWVALSRCFPASAVLQMVRAHWAIENHLHRALDVVFQEDLSRSRKGNAPRNLSTLRHLTMNILRAHPKKTSLNMKRQRAAWDDTFLIELMTHMR